MSKTKTESKFKLKNYISYIMVIAVLGVSVILQLTGNLQRSASTLLVQIAYSIILAVSLNLVVGFLGELSLGHFDAGFTLRTYTHVTRQMQESAAEKMGNFMAQVM